MICFPNAKINLGLHVRGKRNDGYHNIETIFYPVELSDILEIIPESGEGINNNTFINTGNTLDFVPSGNLCLNAWKEFNNIRPVPNIRIYLHKIIPAGAGLGGGSSNAAFVLKTVNELFEVNLPVSELVSIAGRIGSDCPFFIYNKPLLATGRGDIFETIEVDLSGCYIIIVYPGTGISSAWAYSRINIPEQSESVKDIKLTDPAEWQGRLKNDFEPAVFEFYPVIRDIKEKLLSYGAFYASMTGSGSAVYGLFDHNVDYVKIKDEFPGMFVWEGNL